MATTIPGTPHNAADIERIALANMDLDTAADRQAEFDVAEHAFQVATVRRNNAVLALVQRGTSQLDVAMRLGVSQQRVSQIVARGHVVLNGKP